jgi:hypothetical protein
MSRTTGVERLREVGLQNNKITNKAVKMPEAFGAKFGT